MVEFALDPFSSLCTTDTLSSAQKGKYILKYQQFQKNLCETVLFFPNAIALQSQLSDFNKCSFQANRFI